MPESAAAMARQQGLDDTAFRRALRAEGFLWLQSRSGSCEEKTSHGILPIPSAIALRRTARALDARIYFGEPWVCDLQHAAAQDV